MAIILVGVENRAQLGENALGLVVCVNAFQSNVRISPSQIDFTHRKRRGYENSTPECEP
jgi:hypothetical protein